MILIPLRESLIIVVALVVLHSPPDTIQPHMSMAFPVGHYWTNAFAGFGACAFCNFFDRLWMDRTPIQIFSNRPLLSSPQLKHNAQNEREDKSRLMAKQKTGWWSHPRYLDTESTHFPVHPLRRRIHAFFISFFQTILSTTCALYDIIRALHVPEVIGMMSGATSTTPDPNEVPKVSHRFQHSNHSLS